MPKWDLQNCDCMETMGKISSGSIDAIVTDPPYGISFYRHRKGRAKFGIIKNDDKPFVDFIPEAFRVLKENAFFVCFHEWRHANTFQKAIEATGFKIKSQGVWDRISHGMGDLKGALAPQHDLFWLATKGKPLFSGSRPRSVLRHVRPTAGHFIHPNQKPIPLMREIVSPLVNKEKNPTIYDPFAGSGSTGVACIELGINFIGSEIDKKYHQGAFARIHKANQDKKHDCLFSAFEM